MKFEGIKIRNPEILVPGRIYFLYASKDDVFIGPTELLAVESKDATAEPYAKAEVYIHSRGLRRTRRVKED